ncbi:hypothetical protein GCM10017559_08180 [Streptosporangium longisporum]|uniref:Uncharacterized protein n=1 Tax=Streptosporangium longisporum TaxID=46187 RepID=A0ABN3XRR9_9ACTN
MADPANIPAAWVDAVYPVTLKHGIPWHDDAIRIMLAAALPAIAEQVRAEERARIADELADIIPKGASIWADGDELAEGHFTDRTLTWWLTTLGHPKAHTGCCAACGCATTCTLGAFYDAVLETAARHIAAASPKET